MPKRVWFLALVLGGALLALAAACGDDEEEVAVPSLEITSPGEGETLSAGDMKVEVQVSNFSVVDKAIGISAACPDSATCPNTAGEGHVHFYLLDPGEAVPTTAGEAAITAEGTYHAGVTTSYTWPEVAAGTYKVAGQLVNNDHTPISPAVVDEIEVEVTGAGGAGGAASTPGPGY